MDILSMLLDGDHAKEASRIGERFGLDSKKSRQVIEQLVPALTGGLGKQATSGDGLENLIGALGSGNHARYLNSPSTLDAADATDDGNRILGHILGSKDVSRKVAANASASSGVDESVIKKMLPLVATLVMGSLSKETEGGSKLRNEGSAGVLGALLGKGGGGGLDDLLGLASKLLG